jgi:tyrosyl-tRNA synthetase
MSFLEFAYPLMQGYDFFHLNSKRSCTLQIGGSDQLGNIKTGIEMILRERKGTEEAENLEKETEMEDLPAYGMTIPLMTTKSGEKFGKSQGNAVWLDREKTSSYTLYQVGLFFSKNQTREPELRRCLKFFRRLNDEEVLRYLKVFGFWKSEQDFQRKLSEVLFL